MSRRTLLLREPLRRRPFGERHHAASHADRRDRRPLKGRIAPAVARRPKPQRRASA